MTNRISTLLLVLFALAAPAFAEPPAEARRLFEQANASFDEGVAQIGRDDAAARAALEQAIAGWRSIIERHGIDSAGLRYNIGNARMMTGETGEAIASYLRARRLDPGEERVRANLQTARQRVRADAVIERAPSLLESAFAWRRPIPPGTRLGVAVAAWAVFWVWLAGRVGGVWRLTWLVGALPAVLVGGAAFGSVLADQAQASAPPVGVVVAEDATGRKGPDRNVYEPSFARPLPEGVEFEVLERRAGWVRARLADGRVTWLPQDRVEIVGARDGG